MQWSCDRSPLLRYVAGYASKYSESWNPQWLEAAETSWAAALNVDRYWRADAVEQAMVLARSSMSQSNFDSIVYKPRQFGAEEDETRRLYRDRDVSMESLSLLQWLRRYHVVPGQVGRVAKPRRQEFFAVGIEYCKLLSDGFFWQWLVMNIPHRTVHSDLKCIHGRADSATGNLELESLGLHLFVLRRASARLHHIDMEPTDVEV